MGYRIIYEPVRKVRRLEARHSSPLALTGLFFLLFLILVNFLWPAGNEVLRDIFLPGDNAVTAAALETMTNELRQGQSMGEALASFCRRVLNNGDFPAY